MRSVIEELWENYKKYILIGGGSVLVVLVVFLLMGKHNSNTNSDALTMNSGENSSEQFSSSNQTSSPATVSGTASGPTMTTSETTSEYVYVDVKGAVKHPGIFKVKNSMRVDDAINLAGGMLKTADRKHINLAQRLTDQQVVYVPIRGEIKGAATGTVDAEVAAPVSSDSTTTSASNDSTSSSETTGGSESTGGTVNLNSATKEQLQTLTSIGDKKADQIIQYREAHGKFKSIDELKEVQGIGDKTFEALKPQLSV